MKIQEAKYFSIFAEEATNFANNELLSINIGYLDGGKPQAKFLGFHECVSGVTGEVIANNMLTQLAD